MVELNGFDANLVEPSASFEPIPADKYLVVVTASELKTTKSGTGSYLQLEFTVIDGEYKGRKIWSRLNINNPNSVAVKIAQGDLSAICRSVGVMQPRDSIELHNLPLMITVKLKKRQDTGELTNEIKGYEPKPTPIVQPQAPTTAPTAPWNR